jgi:acetyltransferase-like isoleucine patch superfamily enzyme
VRSTRPAQDHRLVVSGPIPLPTLHGGQELSGNSQTWLYPAQIKRALSIARNLAHPARRWYGALLFRSWALRLDFELRRKGGRLALEATGVPELNGMPRIVAKRQGEGDGVLTLRLGEGVRLGRGVVLEVWAEGTNLLEIGDHSVLSGCILQLRSGSIRTADHVQIRDFSVVKSYGELRLGSRSIVSYCSAIHCESQVVIKDLVGMAERVTVVDSDKLLNGGDDFFNDRPGRVDPVVIGRNTYVGAGVVITRGSRIGPNSAVAANAVVNGGEHPAGSLIGGVPARTLKKLGETA